MLNENLLWRMTLSPTGKIVKEETFLGALLVFLGIAGAGAVLAFLILVAF